MYFAHGGTGGFRLTGDTMLVGGAAAGGGRGAAPTSSSA